MKQRWRWLPTICCLAWLLTPGVAWTVPSVMVVTYRAAESGNDRRYDYDTAALRLALEKTRGEYGDFRLEPSPPMNYLRAIEDARSNSYPNFFIKLSYEDRYAGLGLSYARFPLDLGIVGYRVCFLRSTLKAQVGTVSSLAELKRYTHGQGAGWADVQILRHNGFTVEEVANYEDLFKMVANSRFDLFCRGTNELLEEYRSHSAIAQLDYDRSFALFYPLPRFLYSSTANKVALERVTKGLQIAYQDGSLKRLWRDHYRQSIDFVQLKKRQLFRIENPLISGIDFDFRKYDFDPLKD